MSENYEYWDSRFQERKKMEEIGYSGNWLPLENEKFEWDTYYSCAFSDNINMSIKEVFDRVCQYLKFGEWNLKDITRFKRYDSLRVEYFKEYGSRDYTT